MIEITKEEAESLLDFIELNFYEVIRNDVDIDNSLEMNQLSLDAAEG